MKSTVCAALVLLALSASQAASQPTAAPTPPQTKLEAFEAQEGVVIIQGFSRIGVLRGAYGRGSVTVSAREFTNATTGSREFGIVLEVKEGGRLERENRSFVDCDEIAPLLKGIDYIGKIDKSVTKLDSFQADCRTKGGLRLSTFNAPSGDVMVAVSSGRISVYLEFADLAALRAHVSSAKDRLDAIKK